MQLHFHMGFLYQQVVKFRDLFVGKDEAPITRFRLVCARLILLIENFVLYIVQNLKFKCLCHQCEDAFGVGE